MVKWFQNQNWKMLFFLASFERDALKITYKNMKVNVLYRTLCIQILCFAIYYVLCWFMRNSLYIPASYNRRWHFHAWGFAINCHNNITHAHSHKAYVKQLRVTLYGITTKWLAGRRCNNSFDSIVLCLKLSAVTCDFHIKLNGIIERRSYVLLMCYGLV